MKKLFVVASVALSAALAVLPVAVVMVSSPAHALFKADPKPGCDLLPDGGCEGGSDGGAGGGDGGGGGSTVFTCPPGYVVKTTTNDGSGNTNVTCVKDDTADGGTP
jgi:hypothetical protein